MNKPYYQEDGVTIYHGDCLDILPELPKVDLVLTDPPYGIADIWVGGKGHGWGKAREEGVLRNKWDNKPPSLEELLMIISKANISIIWGGNYFNLPLSRGWLVWTKPERNFTLSEAELAWTNRDTIIKVFDGIRSDSKRQHPTQKPIQLIKWCLQLVSDNNTVLDPFLGSGTTAVACKQLGRKCIGIEIEEKYCEIAVKRLAQKEMF